MTIPYTSATSTQAANYSMIVNGTAFDTSPSQYAAMLQEAMTNLQSMLILLAGFDAVPTELSAAAKAVDELIEHLDYQYKNVITNMQLVSSGISDAIGYGVIGQPGAPSGSLANPTASLPNYFGSIMGSSNAYVAQIANVVAALTAQAAALLTGAIISQLATCTDERVLDALGDLVDAEQLQAVLGDLTPANLAILSSAMTAIGQLLTGVDANSTLLQIQEIAEVAQALGLNSASN